MTQPFERYPELAAWIERLAGCVGLTLEEWGEFLSTLNAVLEPQTMTFDVPELPDSVYAPASVTIGGYLLKLTCGACPEQYDATLNGQQVGYLRLRHGHFRVDVPDCGGETIYEASPKGDGEFFADERALYLRNAVAAIANWRLREALAGNVAAEATTPSNL